MLSTCSRDDDDDPAGWSRDDVDAFRCGSRCDTVLAERAVGCCFGAWGSGTDATDAFLNGCECDSSGLMGPSNVWLFFFLSLWSVLGGEEVVCRR